MTAVGALGALAGAPGSGAVRGGLAALIVVVLAWWGSGRRTASWWLVAAEAAVVTFGCLVLPSPQPMLGLLFGTTTRRAVRAELGPWLVRAAPAYIGYVCAALWNLVLDGSGVAPDQLAPNLLPLLGLVIGTLALGDTVAAVDTAKAASRATAAVNEHLDAILRTSPVALVVVGPAGVVEMCNDEARVLFEWTAGGAHTVPCPHHDDVTACRDRCLDLLRAAGVAEWTYRKKPDGTTRSVAVRVSEVQDRSGGSPSIVLAFLDISVRKDLEDRLRAQLEYDDLTGVASRGRLTELLDDALTHCGPGRRPTLLLVDL
ncbi:PAS domain S-box protein, partial [Actinophytocola sp.]|uniref:PAS domain S-box protein n=1 Tax=Actinophytocola sp. TaxID=1872138 RepID=UPI00389A45F9